MKYTKRLFLAVFMLAFLTPAVAPAMGERPLSHPMCDMSGKTKVFVLSSDNGEVKETFKVPVRYMSMPFERNGKVHSTLNISARLENLEPRCKEDGKSIFPKEESLDITLRLNLSSVDKWEDLAKTAYIDTDRYQFEEIDIEGYPDFYFKASNSRPAPKSPTSATYGYIPVYAKKDVNIPTYFRTECRLSMDMKTIDLCRINFLYKERIAVRTQFPSTELENLERVYILSTNLIKKFHIK